MFAANPSPRQTDRIDSIESYTEAIQSDLRKIQSRNWWSWSNTVVVVLLLTGTIVTFTLPSFLREDQQFAELNLNLAIRGLIGLVLLFNIYSLWQQLRIKKLYDEIRQKQASSDALYRMAMFDPLTGLYNRRFAQPRIDAEIHRCQRRRTPLTLLLLDLDGFKQINDGYGHTAGDKVLRAFGDHLAKASRGSDLAARLGGDEFMLLLPDCGYEQLQHVLDRLFGFTVEIDGTNTPVAFSAGWKEYEIGLSSADFFDAADRALYENKRGPRPRNSPVPV